jgi:hypothetical protein
MSSRPTPRSRLSRGFLGNDFLDRLFYLFLGLIDHDLSSSNPLKADIPN